MYIIGHWVSSRFADIWHFRPELAGKRFLAGETIVLAIALASIAHWQTGWQSVDAYLVLFLAVGTQHLWRTFVGPRRQEISLVLEFVQGDAEATGSLNQIKFHIENVACAGELAEMSAELVPIRIALVHGACRSV